MNKIWFSFLVSTLASCGQVEESSRGEDILALQSSGFDEEEPIQLETDKNSSDVAANPNGQQIEGARLGSDYEHNRKNLVVPEGAELVAYEPVPGSLSKGEISAQNLVLTSERQYKNFKKITKLKLEDKLDFENRSLVVIIDESDVTLTSVKIDSIFKIGSKLEIWITRSTPKATCLSEASPNYPHDQVTIASEATQGVDQYEFFVQPASHDCYQI